MRSKKMLLGYYDYTVILTYCGMLSAFAGILNAVNGNFRLSLIFLMFTGFCDMFDGAVASTKDRNKSEKRFGIQIDSLSDLISFGVLPAVFVYMYSEKTALSAIASSLYLLFALIRLSYFNVLEEERQDSTSESRSEYLGVPVTTSALLLPLVYLLYEGGIIRNILWFSVIILVLGKFFVIAVKVRKPHTLGKIIMLLLGISEAVGLMLLK
jgi:CDP-diacylglycerol--serine O-phosphatidyltransferase